MDVSLGLLLSSCAAVAVGCVVVVEHIEEHLRVRGVRGVGDSVLHSTGSSSAADVLVEETASAAGVSIKAPFGVIGLRATT